MSRVKFFGAMALIAMTCLSARAAAPGLPPDVIAADTVAVVHVDAAHFNPDQLQSSATAILGANANKVDAQLKLFKDKFDKASAAGAQAITMVVGNTKKPADAAAAPAPDAPPAKNGNAVVYIQLKEGADVKALEALILEDMKPEEKAKTVFDQAGSFLAMHEKDQTFPVKPDADRTALFADAMGTIADASVQIAFIPDQSMRDDMIKQADDAPKGVKESIPLLAKSKWMTVSVMLGNAPGFTLTANAANDADAKSISDNINSGLADLKAQAANPGPNGNPMLALAGPLIGQLLDGLKPTTTGTQVAVSVKTESLKMVAGFAANFGLLGPGRGAGPGAGPAPQ